MYLLAILHDSVCSMSNVALDSVPDFPNLAVSLKYSDVTCCIFSSSGPGQCGEVFDTLWAALEQKALPVNFYSNLGGPTQLLHARPG